MVSYKNQGKRQVNAHNTIRNTYILNTVELYKIHKIRNCAWKVIEPKRMVKLFSGIAHNSASEDIALHTSPKSLVKVPQRVLHPVMLPSMITYQ